jgi:hypothetical protein
MCNYDHDVGLRILNGLDIEWIAINYGRIYLHTHMQHLVVQMAYCTKSF